MYCVFAVAFEGSMTAWISLRPGGRVEAPSQFSVSQAGESERCQVLDLGRSSAR